MGGKENLELNFCNRGIKNYRDMTTGLACFCLSLETYRIHLSSIAIMIASYTISILVRGSIQKLE